jgi:hypothetical protein
MQNMPLMAIGMPVGYIARPFLKKLNNCTKATSSC